MIEIDGSFGEGGGQILRTALSLSCLLQKPFEIINIRKNRKKPGLMPQHLVCVEAAQRISGARVEGGEKGSTRLSFSPGRVKGGEYVFDIGTAGSTSLVAQTVVPALLFAGRRSSITLRGGTHVPFSPPFHYLSEVFAPLLEKMGIMVRFSLVSCGFYPRGGGEIHAEVFPAGEILPVHMTKRGTITAVRGYSGVGNLPLSIAERQRSVVLEKVQSLEGMPSPVTIELLEAPTPGQGTFVFLLVEAEQTRAGFSSIGEKGKKAEIVGGEAADELIRYYQGHAALDQHMADQIVLYMALCKGESTFTTACITEHLLTNLWVIRRFLPVRSEVGGERGEKGDVTVYPALYAPV